ncbi:hypothetical protein ABZT03_23080 [Streptomyces sp. NPDC005574]|uniref:hypothetical protein n=1 Tax=Streptomyces sp. NPDC005574 TaxID=3156891 RepID=UPI0033A6891F
MNSGLEPSSFPDSAAVRNGNLPQGLKSSPSIPNPSYPHLGFNPTPGSVDTVGDLHKKLANCAKTLEEAHGLVTKLLDGSYWKGDAAVAFREQLDGGPLPLNLKNAAHSLHKAARQLDRWKGELDDFQRRAAKLESDAKDAQAALDAAKGRATKAKADAGADKKSGHHDEAQKALTHANAGVAAAQAELDKVIGKAKRLAEEHKDKAEYRAGRIRDATKKLAPHEPGEWDTFTDWLGDNLPDVLSACAAVLGVIALLGLTAIAPWMLFLAAGLLSGVAFGLRVSDPEVMASLNDGFTKGELDLDFWSNTLGVAGDFLGMLPGLGVVLKGGYLGFRAAGESGQILSLAGEGDEVLTLGQRIARAGTNAGTSIKSMGTSIKTEAAAAGGAVSLLAHPRVFGGRLAPVVEKIDMPATLLGAGTAVYGVASSAVDSLDSDAASVAGSLLDGPRTLGVDLPATVGALHFLLRGAGEAS